MSDVVVRRWIAAAPSTVFAFFTDTSLVEAGLLAATFVLCSLIGIERQ